MMIINGQSVPGCRDRLFALFMEHLAPRAEVDPAQRLVLWAAAEGDPDRFSLVEVYNDAAALERNAQAEWFWAYMAQAGPLMAAEPEVRMLTPRWATGTAP